MANEASPGPVVIVTDLDDTPRDNELKSPQPSPEVIRKAFDDKNKDLSKALHKRKLNAGNEEEFVSQHSMETHKSFGDYVKSIIYGGLDGIITTFAVVSGVAGADLNVNVVLVLGFANLFADGLSMGIGDYLSEYAELDFARSERKREYWEFENFQEGEIAEMKQIYLKKGISSSDADLILTTMAKYPDFFVDHMMVEELDIKPREENESPIKNGLVTSGSFMFFGCVPLLSYIIFSFIPFHGYDPKFVISVILTVLTLAALGAIKGRLTESSMWKSAIFVTFNGASAAGASYFIGWALSQMTGIHGQH